MQIDVDLEVFKALTGRLEHENQTHNDVIRELLHLDSILEESIPESAMVKAFGGISNLADVWSRPAEAGFYSRGLFLPDGTKLRAKYKGDFYEAEITNGKWVDGDGIEHSSPSAAATAVTGNNVNGLRFWEASTPSGHGWRRLEFIRNRQAHNG